MDRPLDVNNDPTLMGNELPRGSTPGPLRHLSEMDHFDVADGEPDIRGWTVRSSDNTNVGEVKDLIVDEGRLTVRYMEVKLHSDNYHFDHDHRVLLPIANARLNDDDDAVVLQYSASEIGSFPMHDHELDRALDDRFLAERYGTSHQYRTNDMRDFFGARRFGRDESSYLRRR